ncbi:hypothetical protein BJV77DRAFT_295819 [Russula vinacea]|nr:hypothetical protein BJV77DRAFT_295819 [Russula vinacea]
MTTLIFAALAVASCPPSPFRPPPLGNSVLFRPPYFDEFNFVLKIKVFNTCHHTRCFLANRRIKARGRLRRASEGARWHRQVGDLHRIRIIKQIFGACREQGWSQPFCHLYAKAICFLEVVLASESPDSIGCRRRSLVWSCHGRKPGMLLQVAAEKIDQAC